MYMIIGTTVFRKLCTYERQLQLARLQFISPYILLVFHSFVCEVANRKILSMISVYRQHLETILNKELLNHPTSFLHVANCYRFLNETFLVNRLFIIREIFDKNIGSMSSWKRTLPQIGIDLFILYFFTGHFHIFHQNKIETKEESCICGKLVTSQRKRLCLFLAIQTMLQPAWPL